MTEERELYKIPAWCPVCERVMRSDKSTTMYIRYKCCDDCYIAFVEEREERWKSGYRPSQDEISNYYDKFNR